MSSGTFQNWKTENMEKFEIKSDKCGGFMVEPHIDTFSTNKIGEINYEI